MKLILKLSLSIFSILIIILLIAFSLQYFFISAKTENIIKSKIITVSQLLNKQMIYFIENGDMDGFAEFLRHIFDHNKDEDKSIQKITMFTGNLKSYLSSGDENFETTIDQELASRLLANNTPEIHFKSDYVEIYQPQKVEPSCIECHYDYTLGSLGSVLYLKFSLDKLKNIKRFNITFNILSFVCILILLSISFYIILNTIIIKPIHKMSIMSKDIAEGDGDLTKRLEVKSKDEIGLTAKWFNSFIDILHKTISTVNNNTKEITNETFRLSDESMQVASNSEQMSTMSNQVSESTQIASEAVNNVSVSANEISQTIDKTAAIIVQLSSTLKEIANNCEKELAIAAQADQQAKDTKIIMQELENSAKEIVDVLEVITEIADQTNLLAINANIEAASAGEAGKGFAVVANEVKDLSKLTTNATQQISSKIEEMRKKTANSVNKIDEISNIIIQVNTISQTIVKSVNEQTITTQDVAQNISSTSKIFQTTSVNLNQAAEKISSVNQNITNYSN